jgi:hypothetical protein
MQPSTLACGTDVVIAGQTYTVIRNTGQWVEVQDDLGVILGFPADNAPRDMQPALLSRRAAFLLRLREGARIRTTLTFTGELDAESLRIPGVMEDYEATVIGITDELWLEVEDDAAKLRTIPVRAHENVLWAVSGDTLTGTYNEAVATITLL